MVDQKQKVVVAGAGLVGSLLSLFLSNRGYRVQVIEKRGDPRTSLINEGRSINLALSHRGLRALETVDVAVKNRVLSEAIPMYGRQMHDEKSRTSFQAYSANNECIYSVSRARLNNCLIDTAEKKGVSFLFNHSIEHVDYQNKTIQIQHQEESITYSTPVLIAADGAFSKVRTSLEKQGLCSSFIDKIDHGYKELDIPSEKGKELKPQTALHIWPRGQYMLIALPNYDDSYTGTLFLPFDDTALSFDELKDKSSVDQFFHEHFPDAASLFPEVAEQYFNNPTSYLANVFTDRWAFGSWLLIGDAAHGIVPFYGQGMNAGFEDCRLLDELLDEYNNDFESAFQSFSANRKKDTDAIAKLAMDNFIEMRDLVADERFLLQKKIEAALSKALPEGWKTLYSEVTFSHTPYSEALARGLKNQTVMQSVMNDESIPVEQWEKPEVWELILKKISGQ